MLTISAEELFLLRMTAEPFHYNPFVTIALLSPNIKTLRLGGGRRERKGREAGEERAGSGSSKRAGSGREMRNANYFNLTMR